MRRGGGRLAAALGATALALAALGTGQPRAADRVFVHARVWTGDPALPAAEALAVGGETLLAVGSEAEARALAGPATEIVDLGGRRVVPGFIDAHLHLLGGGFALDSLRLDEAGTMRELLDRVRAWTAAHPGPSWITGEGWTYAAVAGGMPTAAQLDAAVADRPAWLVSYDGHTGWANSAALRLAGVGRETKDPPGGSISRDASGEPTGVLKESAQRLVDHLLPEPSAQDTQRAFERAIGQAAAWGLTGVHQAGISEEDLQTLAVVLDRRPLLRVYAALRMERDPGVERLARQQELRARHAAGRLRVGAVKGFVDGVVEAETAAMFEPYPGGGTGLPEWTQEELDRAVAAYDRAGWQVMLHAIGDRGIDMALTAFERAAALNRTSGRRHRVEHVEVPRTADLPRFRAGGVVASTQATFPYPNANHLDVYLPTLGPERSHRALVFASIDQAGAVQAFGSDWPVFSADVLRAIACVVTRTTREGTPAGGWEPAQRLSVEAALRHYTADAAWAEHAEADRGTLMAGKKADFVVLSQDLLAVAPERVKDTQVLRTVLGGRDTYRAEAQ